MYLHTHIQSRKTSKKNGKINEEVININLIFDLDDTLYDPMKPFKKAFTKVFDNININLEKLYKYSRKYSDEAFTLCENGEISIKDLRIYRITKAMKEFGIDISKEKASQFQENYENNQKYILLKKGFKEILNYCKDKNLNIGIITNGPQDHQFKKIESLNLLNWFKRENIFISGELGYAKPCKKIFDIAVKQMNIENQENYYIGDNFINDIEGAKNAGWNTIWFNEATVEIEEMKKYCDYKVDNTQELYELIKMLNNNRVD